MEVVQIFLDGQTDRPTDLPTNITTYRSSQPELKNLTTHNLFRQYQNGKTLLRLDLPIFKSKVETQELAVILLRVNAGGGQKVRVIRKTDDSDLEQRV